jgi:hypothetical protein
MFMVKSRKTNRKSNRKKRPIAVAIIALIAIGEILLRLYWVARTAIEYTIWEKGFPWPLWESGGLTQAGSDMSLAAFRLVWLAVGLVVLIGLTRMRRWSWVMLMAWVGMSLTIGIIRFFYRDASGFGPADFAVMAADVVLVFVLNQSDVQHIFGIRRSDVEPAK